MNTKSRAVNWISVMGAPLALIVIACLQIYLTQTEGLSRWKGGGFGMFSTLDSPSARFLRIYIITENGEFPVEVPGHLAEVESKVRAVPTESNLSMLSVELAQARWIHNDGASQVAVNMGSGEVSINDSSSNDRPLFRALGRGEISSQEPLVNVQAIRVEVWRYSAAPSEDQLVATRLLVETIPVTQETFAE